MSAEQTSYLDALQEGAAEIGLSVSEEQREALWRHQALVNKWASRMNLTTVRDPRLAAQRHALDCLLLAALFDVDDDSATVDIGSGAGFPGVVLAVARPKLRLTLVEPTRKRASFLRVALAELNRPDVQVIEGRLASGATMACFPADAMVSRATIPPLQLTPLAAPYLRPSGRLVLMSGEGAPSVVALEAAAASAGMERAGRHIHRLPGGETRVLDDLRRVSVDDESPQD